VSATEKFYQKESTPNMSFQQKRLASIILPMEGTKETSRKKICNHKKFLIT
jgi:hypothetical protein